MSGIAVGDVIRRTRFLVVDGDKNALNRIEQILQAAGAPKVFLAPAPIVALRTLQDPASRVDCIICAHKTGTITGLQFLQTLRSGRWGSGRIQNAKFILVMGRLDVPAVQVADAANVSGYVIGEFDQSSFTAEIEKALTGTRPVSPLPKMQVAHVNMSGVDFVLVPLEAAFAGAGLAYQQNVMGELQSMMQEQLLAGAVTPVWETADHGVGYFAAPQYHNLLAALTFDFVRANLNRELTVLRPPPYAVLSSPGSAVYQQMLAAEYGAAAHASGGPQVAPEAAADYGSGPQGIAGGPPPQPDDAAADPSSPQGVPNRGVHGAPPPAPQAPERPEFGGPRGTPTRGVHGGPQGPRR